MSDHGHNKCFFFKVKKAAFSEVVFCFVLFSDKYLVPDQKCLLCAGIAEFLSLLRSGLCLWWTKMFARCLHFSLGFSCPGKHKHVLIGPQLLFPSEVQGRIDAEGRMWSCSWFPSLFCWLGRFSPIIPSSRPHTFFYIGKCLDVFFLVWSSNFSKWFQSSVTIAFSKTMLFQTLPTFSQPELYYGVFLCFIHLSTLIHFILCGFLLIFFFLNF